MRSVGQTPKHLSAWSLCATRNILQKRVIIFQSRQRVRGRVKEKKACFRWIWSVQFERGSTMLEICIQTAKKNTKSGRNLEMYRLARYILQRKRHWAYKYSTAGSSFISILFSSLPLIVRHSATLPANPIILLTPYHFHLDVIVLNLWPTACNKHLNQTKTNHQTNTVIHETHSQLRPRLPRCRCRFFYCCRRGQKISALPSTQPRRCRSPSP